ncbi:indole-diterpene biosynthesis protein [Moniliophthora roreri MCA 2997]|uniref:Indole-diterpene biosynthesis protein n=1 Tax=Moniliophthora roreri (strain MCA 2997) TaxID=1381753 RepID=V2X9S7_MONRO|nr:indole-diterpene biosynthesis protein [Moniliophthora roreri MCA 2997]
MFRWRGCLMPSGWGLGRSKTRVNKGGNSFTDYHAGNPLRVLSQPHFCTSVPKRWGMNGHSQPTPSEPVQIGEGIYLRRAKSSGDETKDPNVILVFGWMAAKLAHIHKYTKVYEELYPNSTQILVRSQPKFFWSRESTRIANLIPVVEVMEALGCIPSKKADAANPPSAPRILVHSFSNGGAMQLITLANLLSARGITPASYSNRKPTSAMVIDSSPAAGTYSSTVKAFTVHIKSPFLRFPMKLFITFLVVIRFIHERVFRARPMFERLRNGLNSRSTLPWMDVNTPRLYLYSKKDELIPWKEVEEHIENGKKAGLNIRSEVFENSAHVAHARAEPNRYWSLIKETWSSALN